MAARTETGVKKTVELVLPEQGTWKVDVDTIPDELPLVRPAVLPYPVESRRKALDWGIVGAVGAAISILAAVGSWIQVARRRRGCLNPRPRPRGIAPISHRSRAHRSVSESWCGATPRPRPACSSAGPCREVAPHDAHPAGSRYSEPARSRPRSPPNPGAQPATARPLPGRQRELRTGLCRRTRSPPYARRPSCS